MKILILLPFIFFSQASQTQNLCLQQMCVAARANMGDTAYIGAGLQQISDFKSIAFTLRSGPNKPVMGSAQTFLTGTDTGVSQIAVTNTVPGTYLFNIVAMDNTGKTVPGIDTLIVTATPPKVNVPPVANAGAAQTITLPVNSATLVGTGSDSDGTIVTYAWIQVGGPSIVSWTNVTPAKTVVGKLIQGTYTFQLTVTDNQGATGKAFTTVTVNPLVVAKTAVFSIALMDGKHFTLYSDGTYQLQ